MATANALAAVEAGARQIECTINGLGERAGNTALEEVVMAMRVRNDILPYRTGIDTTKIMNLSRRVSTVSGFPGAVQQGHRRQERLPARKPASIRTAC
jgi:2-isopropylmalate synthase